jgi:hypothetical protein
MAPTFSDLGRGDVELDIGKEEDEVTATALPPVNLGIPLGAAFWPCDVRTTVHHHDDEG